MTERQPRPDSAPGERRQGERRTARSAVRVTLDATTLAGSLENVSETDLLFATRDGLRVEVELEEDGELQRVPGRLVRGEALGGGAFRWAVELER